MTGLIKKEKAAPLGIFLPLAWKMAKELEGTGSGGGFKFDITQTTKKLSVELTDDLMDRYIRGDEALKIEIIDELQKDGKIKTVTNDAGLEIDASSLELKDVKTDLEGIVQISKHTDVPVTRKQARKLFGSSLGDKKHVNQEVKSEATGFGDLFELPDKQALPDGALHKWKGAYEPSDNGLAALWFTCQQCKKKVRNCDQYKGELCEPT